MMKLGKGRLLAVLLAAVAVMAVAGSATASAAVWKMGGTEVTTEFSLGLSGASDYEIEESKGGVNCEEHMSLRSTGKSNATISAWENKKCSTPLGTLSKCTITGSEAIGLPWSVTLGTSTLTINSMHVKHTFKSGCVVSEINQTMNVTMTPDSKSAITKFELLGTSGTNKIFGSYTIDSPNSGTYGFG
ncbi:MAG TPA: hypothetical protein VGI73_02540 [Solirubrobacterales bacterium]|jgi:hypothetical protein